MQRHGVIPVGEFKEQKRKPIHMNKSTSTEHNNMESLIEDARALLNASAHVAEEEVVAARKRLSETLNDARDTCGRVQAEALERARAADKAVHEHPYQAIGIAFGVGALLAMLATRRN
jgi:ElaB/YqjD/DUF883 family membrane-anchored ribosome-binding protein